MHFRTAASVVVLAYAASVQAADAVKPRIAVMAMPGQSLMRRDTDGYQPEEATCHEADTCAEACGTGFTECASTDGKNHCFNPTANQSCCPDGSGNSCDAGYYCANDGKKKTWCCPQDMDLAACAAAYDVSGGLVKPVSSTSVAPTTSAKPTPTPEPTTSSTPPPPPPTTSSVITTSEIVVVNTTTPVTTIEVTTAAPNTTVHTTTCTGLNMTTSVETSLVPITTSIVTAPVQKTTPSGPETTAPDNAAVATGVSAMLLAAAGFVALL